MHRTTCKSITAWYTTEKVGINPTHMNVQDIIHKLRENRKEGAMLQRELRVALQAESGIDELIGMQTVSVSLPHTRTKKHRTNLRKLPYTRLDTKRIRCNLDQQVFGSYSNYYLHHREYHSEHSANQATA